MNKAQARMDEFALVLMAGLILIAILMVVWSTPEETVSGFLNVTPDFVKTNIQLNTSSVVLLDFNGTANNVSLSVTGEIRPWISFDQKKFDVDGLEMVEMTIDVPPSADNRTYNGNLVVSYDTKQKLTIPLTIIVSSEVVENFKLVSLGSFLVSGGATETLDSRESSSVSQGLFSGNKVTLSGSLSTDKLSRISGGLIRLFVDDTNSLGGLIVTFNGEKIFDQKVGVGELKIEVNKSLIMKTNTIVISAGSPGAMFWASTDYQLRSAEFSVNYPTESKEFIFSLNRNEVENFKYARATFSVSDYKLPLSNLKILVNDQLVYISTPPLVFFRESFSRTIFGDKLILNTGENEISFAFDGQGYYSLADASMVIAYGG